MGPLRKHGIAMALGAVALAFPAAADAAQTIGQVGAGDGSGCTNRVFVQHDLSSGPGYSPSSAGVITSWSSQSNANSGQTLQLLVLKQNADLEYTILHRDTVRALTNLNALNTFSGLHMPINAGELIGVYEPDGSNADCEYATSSADQVAFSDIGAVPDNTAVTYFGFDFARVDARAVVEPDADRDGFGDETQDQCPSNAATQGPCPAHKKKCKKKHKRRDASAAKKRCKRKKR
jgi:hypothetical protein